MRVLTFADLHTPCIDKIKNIDFQKENCDVCFTLGDINTETLKAIQNSVNCSIYTVLGNHDDFADLSELSIEYIDKRKVEMGGFSVVGLSGSSRYKEGNYPMLTQSESIRLSKKLPCANILVSHDSAYGLYGVKSDYAHCGLKGITRYIKKHKPLINIHGHHHENKVQFYKGTTDICVFGCSIIGIYKNGLSGITRVF